MYRGTTYRYNVTVVVELEVEVRLGLTLLAMVWPVVYQCTGGLHWWR